MTYKTNNTKSMLVVGRLRSFAEIKHMSVNGPGPGVSAKTKCCALNQTVLRKCSNKQCISSLRLDVSRFSYQPAANNSFHCVQLSQLIAHYISVVYASFTMIHI